MSDTVNPIDPPTALLRPLMPGVYLRQMIYDTTWNDPSYNAYTGQRIVPAPGSIVKDVDQTPLWVESVADVTLVPSYGPLPLSTENDSIVSMLDYGNTVLRLYVDNRALPYNATPDSKCIFIGKSPRSFTLSRYPGTAQETIISQYYDSTGKLVSQFVPLVALDTNNNSWYLPRCKTAEYLGDNEEIGVKVFSEDGSEVFSALLFTKQSAVINEDVLYSSTIVGMTVTSNQTLANGSFYLYEKQDFASLGLSVSLVYEDGSVSNVPIDGQKCILYGQSDFISSFSGLTQKMTVKYYRSAYEAISPGLADQTGSMISSDVNVTVIPNTLGVTNKIIPIPIYNATLARYVMYYWLYYADGRSHVNVTPNIVIQSGSVVTDSSFFGVQQSYVVSVDMNKVDPVKYPTSAIYQQNIVIQFGPPNTLVRWTIRDALTSQYIYGQDVPTSRRPVLKWDAVLKQYFIPNYIFGNSQAVVNSFYTQAAPPYDPTVSLIPQQPTHFTIRDPITGSMLIAAPIPLSSFDQAFNILGDTTGNYLNAVLMVEFLNVINSSTTNVLFGAPADVSAGSYIAVSHS